MNYKDRYLAKRSMNEFLWNKSKKYKNTITGMTYVKSGEFLIYRNRFGKFKVSGCLNEKAFLEV